MPVAAAPKGNRMPWAHPPLPPTIQNLVQTSVVTVNHNASQTQTLRHYFGSKYIQNNWSGGGRGGGGGGGWRVGIVICWFSFVLPVGAYIFYWDIVI